MTIKEKAEKYEELVKERDKAKAEVEYWRKLCKAYDTLVQGYAGAPGLITAGYQQIEAMRDKTLESWINKQEGFKKDSLHIVEECLEKIKRICQQSIL